MFRYDINFFEWFYYTLYNHTYYWHLMCSFMTYMWPIFFFYLQFISLYICICLFLNRINSYFYHQLTLPKSIRFFYNIHLLTDKIIVNYLSPNYDKYHDKFNITNKRLNSLILKDSKKLLIKVLKIKCPVERALDNETLNWNTKI